MNKIVSVLILFLISTLALAVNPGEFVVPDVTMVSANPSVNPTSNTWRMTTGTDGDGSISLRQYSGIQYVTKFSMLGAHLSLLGSTPTINSGDCGATTNGSVAGTDHSGKITIGAAATTACKVTFGAAWSPAPDGCVFSPASAGASAITVLAYVSAITTTYFTISGSVLASTVFNYWCE